jgi:hypothetical protein
MTTGRWLIFSRCVPRLRPESAWPSRGLDAEISLGVFQPRVRIGDFFPERQNQSQGNGTHLACLLPAIPGSAMLLRVLDGPTAEANSAGRSATFWSLALPKSRTTRTITNPWRASPSS